MRMIKNKKSINKGSLKNSTPISAKVLMPIAKR